MGAVDDTSIVIYLNWFSIKFLSIYAEEHHEFTQEASAATKGSDMYINSKVDSIDEFYPGMVAKGCCVLSTDSDLYLEPTIFGNITQRPE